MGQVNVFETFEERQTFFQESTGTLCPSMTSGPGRFFGEIWTWVNASGSMARDQSLIPGDPSLALVFPTPRDELTAAATRARDRDVIRAIQSALRDYRLSDEMLNRSIRTLSGGERCLLALAKCALLAEKPRELIMCYPGQWLSSSNRSLVQSTLYRYDACGSDWKLLALDGEILDSIEGPSLANHDYKADLASDFGGPRMRIQLSDLSVILTDTTGMGQSLPLQLRYQADDSELVLSSPMVLHGENGLGKSTLSQVLAGCIQRETGSFKIHAGGYGGLARLLMQESPYQLLGKSPSGYLSWTFREAPNALQKACAEFDLLQADVARRLGKSCQAGSIGSIDSPDSLIQAKIALVAARLVQRTPLLILDEPGFGLSRCAAVAFVEAVALRAKEFGTGLLIISHVHDWYGHVVKSHVELRVESTTPRVPRGRVASRNLLLTSRG